MTAVICPTVTAATPHEYREQLERLLLFAQYVHIDLMDGKFAPTLSIAPEQVWFPEELKVDIHIMYQNPLAHLETLIALKPSMIIFHAEANGDIFAACQHIQKLGIKAGIALLQPTEPHAVRDLIAIADHALIFGGKLGSFGGEADLAMIDKITLIEDINPTIEIGWDGGANDSNAGVLASAGIHVINVGSAIQHADEPALAYQKLVENLI